MLGIARGSGLNIVGQLVTQGSSFAVSLLLARVLGSAGLGVYAQAFALMSLLQVVAMGGLHTGAMRFVAINRAEGDPARLGGAIYLALLASAVFSVLLALALFAGAPWLAAQVFSEPELLMPIRYVSLALPAATLTGVALGASQGFKTMRIFAGVGLIGEPLLRLGLTAAAILFGTGVRGALIAVVASQWTAAAGALAGLFRMAGKVGRPVWESGPLFRFSALSWLGSLSNSGLVWVDTVLLGIYLPSSQVGIYSVATRLVVLASLAQTAINQSVAPRISDLHHRNDRRALERIYRTSAGWTVRLALPVFVLLLVFPDELLGLFGSGFAAAGGVTALLVAGKFVDTATGPCALMLNMSGRPLINTVNNWVVLAINVALNVLLIPRFGIAGAAAAWSVSLVLVNAARVLQVKVVLGMWPFDRGLLKGLAGAALAALPAGLAGMFLAGLPALVVGGAVLGVVYAGAIIALGLTTEDQLVLGALKNRLTRA